MTETTASWDASRRAHCASLLTAIAADLHRFADLSHDREDRLALRAAEAAAIDTAHQVTGPGVGPGGPDRLADAGRELAACAGPGCARLGAELVQVAASLRTFYLPGRTRDQGGY